jgi:hypothetical protein
MVLSTYKLPNDNVLIWLGTGGLWGKTQEVDNVLVLAGGDVLFLRTVKTLPLYEEKVMEDIRNLTYKDIVAKYELPASEELVLQLKEGLKAGKYPPVVENAKSRVAEFRSMISAYISEISQLRDKEEWIRQLKEIVEECNRQILLRV